MNSNLFHNILNVVFAVPAVIMAVLLATGCTTLANGDLECSKSFIDPTYTTTTIAIIGATKMAINIMPDGLKG